jgi:chemotaxis protein CheD
MPDIYSLLNETCMVDIQIGEVKYSKREIIFSSNAIGSCITAILLDPLARVGGLAHLMLPGVAPEDYMDLKTRYTWDGLSALRTGVLNCGAKPENLRICLVGAANVLMDPEDTLCETIIHSVFSFCQSHQLSIVATSLGGFQRRRVVFDLPKLTVYCAIGNEPDTKIWEYR